MTSVFHCSDNDREKNKQISYHVGGNLISKGKMIDRKVQTAAHNSAH